MKKKSILYVISVKKKKKKKNSWKVINILNKIYIDQVILNLVFHYSLINQELIMKNEFTEY